MQPFSILLKAYLHEIKPYKTNNIKILNLGVLDRAEEIRTLIEWVFTEASFCRIRDWGAVVPGTGLSILMP